MRDGVVLRADVYRPATATPVPVILYRTQYNKEKAQVDHDRYQSPDWFASHCYLVVTQDIRGLYASDGVFAELANDQGDGYDSVEWAARLPGSNGKVGMYGTSYVAVTQWLAAEAEPPHLVTIVPTNMGGDFYNGVVYEDGAFRLRFAESWALSALAGETAARLGDKATVKQIRADAKQIDKWVRFTPYLRFPPLHPENPAIAGFFYDWLRHRTDSDYWQQWSPKRYYPKINIPVLNFDGWYDGFLAGGINNFTGMVAGAATPFARANQRLVIGPWDHLGWGRPGSTAAPLLKAIGPIANSPINELMLAWWDHYLKGVDNGIGGAPRVDYFRMGSNTWHHSPSWPPTGAQNTPLYLHSGGRANTASGDGTLSANPPTGAETADHYRYDPANPVPTVGGHSCCSSAGNTSQGPYEQGQVEQRPDVLVYTTAPLTQDTDVTGPLSVTLYASSTAPDTDWTAKLDVVHPDGQSVNLTNGIQRASYRDSSAHPSPITPGQVYRYTVDVWPTSNLFHAGDRIRLAISSSDFPQFDPNPNTGGWLGDSTATQPAEQTILHDPTHPSALTLSTIPNSARPPVQPGPPAK